MMIDSLRITLLGTGTSHGVPTIDCMLNDYARCPNRVCQRAQTRPDLRRTRSSALVEWGGASVLIDTSQDFRQQALDRHVGRIDAVLYTHGHADHIYGLPDIRSYCRAQDTAIPVYGSVETLNILSGAFDYVFQPTGFVGGGIPVLDARVLDRPTTILGREVIPIPVVHGPLNGCQGYRIGGIAYVPDVKEIPEASMGLLESLDLLVIDCLRLRTHATHVSLEESIAYAERLGPRRCVLTHMAHDIDADVHRALLPGWAEFGADGIVLDASRDSTVKSPNA